MSDTTEGGLTVSNAGQVKATLLETIVGLNVLNERYEHAKNNLEEDPHDHQLREQLDVATHNFVEAMKTALLDQADITVRWVDSEGDWVE